MSTAAARAPELTRRDWISMCVGILVTCAAAYLLTRLSLDSVSGATRRPDGSCCNTSFVHTQWWLALAVLAIPIWWVSRFSPWAGLFAGAVATYATFHIASTSIRRYVESGWGDGLESLSYVLSVLHFGLFVIAVAVGFFSWRRRRRRT